MSYQSPSGPRPVSPVPYTPGWPPVTYPRQSSALAVATLVLGVVGILAGWCMLGLPNLAAIVIGHVALNDTKDDRKTGRGMAVAGLILGYVALVPAVVLFFWFGLAMFAGGTGAVLEPSPSPSY